MTFLNALMLLGLAAVAVPLVIHLFHRRQVSTVDFSSVIFIRDHHLQRSQALRLRELLLLLLRTLIILLLVLAFARPVVEGLAGSFIGSGLKQRSVFVIVLDNSYSMDAGRYDVTPFSAAKTEAGRIIDSMRAGDEGSIMLSAAPPEGLPPAPTTRMDTLRELLADVEVSERSGDIAGALDLARQKLAGIAAADKRIYLLSDLQRSDWQNLAESAAVDPSQPGPLVYLYAYEAGNVDNASVDAVSVSEGLLIRDQPEQFVATVTNRNGAATNARQVSLVINGEKRGTRQVTADAGGTGTVQFNILIDRPGRYVGYVELDEDDLAADNRRYFTLSVPDAFGVTAVGRTESRYFIEQVLQPSGGLVTPVDLRTASADVLNSDLYDAGVLIVDGGVELTPARLSSLERYIASGGGVLLFLGDGLGPSNYANRFFTDVFGSSIRGRRGATDRKQTFLRMDQVDHEHPVFRFAGPSTDALSTGAARFYASFAVDVGSDARVIARFADGSPAILEGRSGSGRAMLVATDVNPGWSDLALRSVFVPFMHRSVRYLHPSVAVADGGYLAGNAVAQPLVRSPADGDLYLEYPSGYSETVNARLGRNGITVEVPDTKQPGVYLLRDGASVVQAFAVNPDTRESDLERFTPAKASGLLGGDGSVFLINPDDPAGVPQERNYSAAGRYEIWKSLVLFVLLLLLVEYWYSGSRNRGNAARAPDGSPGPGVHGGASASGGGLTGRLRHRMERFFKSKGLLFGRD